MKTVRMIFAENDGGEIGAANGLGGEGVFEIAQPDSLFVPYGEYPHAKGLQVFDRESGEMLAAAFNSVAGRIKRIFSPGVPVYRGHPDVPGRPDSDPAAPAMGWVQGVEVENDGVRLPVKWNPDGEAAVANAHYRFYSPHWLLRKVAGGIQPVRLLSVGLTNNPRIPVPAIANAEDVGQPQETNTMPQWLIDMLAAAGLIAAGETDEGKIKAAMQRAMEAMGKLNYADSLAGEAAQLREQAAAINDKVAVLEGEKAALAEGIENGKILAAKLDEDAKNAVAALAAANDSLAAARAALVDRELARLMDAGKILPGEAQPRRAELLALENDAALALLDEMGKAKPAIKTERQTAGLGAAKARLVQAENDAAARSERRREKIAAALALTSSDLPAQSRYDLAYERAAKADPELFGGQQ